MMALASALIALISLVFTVYPSPKEVQKGENLKNLEIKSIIGVAEMPLVHVNFASFQDDQLQLELF